MHKNKSYQNIIRSFEDAVIQMQKDLEYLSTKDNPPSFNFFEKQNRVLKALIDYYNATENHIEKVHIDSLNYQKAKRKQLQFYKDRVVSFEAICIIHGITDFPTWLKRGKLYLLDEAENLGKQHKMRIPYLLNYKIERLPKNERASILNILQKDLNQKLKQFLTRLSKTTKDKLRNEFNTQRNKPKY